MKLNVLPGTGLPVGEIFRLPLSCLVGLKNLGCCLDWFLDSGLALHIKLKLKTTLTGKQPHIYSSIGQETAVQCTTTEQLCDVVLPYPTPT